MNLELSDRLEKLQGDLHDVNEAKKAIKNIFMEKIKFHIEYAGFTELEAGEHIDDMLSDAFDTRNLEQEIEELEYAQASEDLEDLRREYYASVL